MAVFEHEESRPRPHPGTILDIFSRDENSGKEHYVKSQDRYDYAQFRKAKCRFSYVNGAFYLTVYSSQNTNVVPLKRADLVKIKRFINQFLRTKDV
jgi:hypothetical protein